MANRTSRLGAIYAKISRTLSVIRLRPFDKSTEEGRSKERMRRAALTALAGAVAKLTSVSTGLISVPLTIHYLGTERYGLWMLITSLSMLLSFADLGMGNGILNAIAHANGKDDTQAMRAIISSGYLILGSIAAAMLIALVLAYPYIPWASAFNVHSAQAQAEAGPAAAVFLTCLALAIPIGVVQRVQIGLQQGFGNGIWQCAGSLLGLIGILIVISYEGGLPWLVFPLAGLPLVASLANTVVLFGFWRPDLRPSLLLASRGSMKTIARVGVMFVALQVISAFFVHSDNLIIAQLLGAGAVATYAVPVQLFGVVGALLAMALQPLWPAYGEAISRGDRPWIKNIVIRSLKISVACAFALSAILVLGGQEITALWTRGAISPPFLLLLGLGFWKVAEAGGVAASMYFYGANALKFLVITTLTTGIFAFGMKLVLIPEIGVAGAVWGTVIAYLLCYCIPAGIFLRRRLAGS